MSAPDDPLPLRQITRLRAEMSMMSAAQTTGLFPDHPVLGVEFGLLARFCLADWTRTGTMMPPEVTTRTITVRQIASSLGAAPETTRRRVNQLRDLGAIVVTARGVALAPTMENAARVAAHCTATHDMLLRLMEDVASTCDLAWPVAAADAATFDDIAGRALDTLLLTIDTFRMSGNRHAFLLWSALTVVAVRAVTYDPVLSRRFANSIPTDDLRQGVSLKPLAASLGVPYATAWRQIHALHAAGLVTRLGKDQWTVLTANLLQQPVLHLGDPPSLALYRRLRELALLGLDPAQASARYLGERPQPAALGMQGSARDR